MALFSHRFAIVAAFFAVLWASVCLAEAVPAAYNIHGVRPRLPQARLVGLLGGNYTISSSDRISVSMTFWDEYPTSVVVEKCEVIEVAGSRLHRAMDVVANRGDSQEVVEKALGVRPVGFYGGATAYRLGSVTLEVDYFDDGLAVNFCLLKAPRK